MVALLFFIWLLEGWFYLIPPPKKKQCLKEEVYYFGGYVPKHSPPPRPASTPKKCLTEEVFLSVTVSNIRLEIYYIHRSYRDFLGGVFMDRDEIKVNNNAKKQNEASQRYRTRLARNGQRTFSCESNAGNPGWARRAHVGKPKSMFKDICGMAQKYNLSKSLFLFSSIFRLR